MRIEAHLEKNPAKVEKSAGKKVIFSSLALGQVPPFIPYYDGNVRLSL
jgi:hypothetical protein